MDAFGPTSTRPLPAPLERHLGVRLVGVPVRRTRDSADLEPPSSGPLVSDSGLLRPRREGAPHTGLHRSLWRSWVEGVPSQPPVPPEALESVEYASRSLRAHWDTLLGEVLSAPGEEAPALALLPSPLELPTPYGSLVSARSARAAAFLAPPLATRALRSRWMVDLPVRPLLLPAEPSDDAAVLETALALWEDAGISVRTARRSVVTARACTRQDPHRGGGPDVVLSCGSPAS